jgi:phosphohistidine swiveling domain-containing protein
MSFFANLNRLDPGLGGKARSLVRLSDAGWITPVGFVVLDDVFRALGSDLALPKQMDQAGLARLDEIRKILLTAAWPTGFAEQLALRLAQASAVLWSVRSSFAGEDQSGGLGAGVYHSVVGIPAAQVPVAIREVLASALSPGAVAYAWAHGLEPAAAPIAVLVHQFIQGQAEGGAAYDKTPESFVVQVRSGQLSAPARQRLRESVESLARQHGPVEVEWTAAEDEIVFLQMRPFVAPPALVEWPGFKDLGASASKWHWDQVHNPLPLSPVHTGLVAMVDQRCLMGFRQRVLGHYLFYTQDSRLGHAAVTAEQAPTRFAALRAEVESRLQKPGASPSLEEALNLFVGIHEPIFGVIQPALRSARARLKEFLREHVPAALPAYPQLLAGVESVASERHRRATCLRAARDPQAAEQARQRYLELFADESPVWDVAVPTCGESPESLGMAEAHGAESSTSQFAETAARVESQVAPEEKAEWGELLALARQAVALGEEDDWLYARAQAAVRRALLQLAKTLREQGALAQSDDVFYLPLDLVRSLAQGTPAPTDLQARADAGRAAWQTACGQPPPVAATADATTIKGVGTGGRAVGRVVIHRPGHPQQARDQVLVAPTLLPSELPLIVAAALVIETGGPLDHVATQARERQLPAVVGAAGATRVLREGDLVLVDADRGLVVRLV